jgi:ubiquinone/menaquinone biosynthesis C-methylase UbiE
MKEPFDPIDDYRRGHFDRGSVYEAVLAADPFDAYMNAWERRRVTELLHRYVPDGVDRCLDFACGTGRMTKVVAPFAREVVGVDISATMIEEARRKLPQARFEVVDLTSNDFDLGSFDLVSSFRFFGNADQALREAVLRELYRRMSSGAYLLVNNHRNPRALMYLVAKLRGSPNDLDLTSAKFATSLAAAGFEIVTSRPIAVWQYRHALAARAGSRPEFEARMERLLSAPFLAPIAPDVVILARKTGPSR